MITLEQINCFRAVYEHQSYSAAARSLNKDRTTVRERVLTIEDTIGLPLFEIRGKKAVATELGRYLYPRARNISKQVDDFEQVAWSACSAQLTELTIHYDTLIPHSLLQAVNVCIKDKAPWLQVHWLHRNRDESFTALEKGQAQLMLSLLGGGTTAPAKVGVTNLGASQYAGYAHPRSSLFEHHAVSLSLLVSEPQWLIENTPQSVLKVFEVSGQIQVVSNVDLMVKLLEQGGWGLLNVEDAEGYVAQGQLRQLPTQELLQAFSSSIVLFYSFEHETNPVIAHLLAKIPELARQYLS